MSEPLKLQATRSLIAKLNPARRAHWTLRLTGIERGMRQRVGAETEWDLALANELDRIYTAVSDEATRVRKEGTAALAETSSAVGYGVWPLALAAVVVLLAYGKAARR